MERAHRHRLDIPAAASAHLAGHVYQDRLHDLHAVISDHGLNVSIIVACLMPTRLAPPSFDIACGTSSARIVGELAEGLRRDLALAEQGLEVVQQCLSRLGSDMRC